MLRIFRLMQIVRVWEKNIMPKVNRMRRYVVTTIVMVVLYGICMFTIWRYLSSATFPEPKLIFSGIGLLIMCQGIVGLISGAMPTKYGMVNRDERPISFWINVIGYIICGVGITFATLGGFIM